MAVRAGYRNLQSDFDGVISANLFDLSGRHVDDESTFPTCNTQVLSNLRCVVLTRLGCWCHVAFPVEDDFRPTIPLLGDPVDDACYTARFIVPNTTSVEYSQFRLQPWTIFGHDLQSKGTADCLSDFQRR